MITILLWVSPIFLVIGLIILYKAIVKSHREYLWAKKMSEIYQDPKLEKPHIERRVNVLFLSGFVLILLWVSITMFLILMME